MLFFNKMLFKWHLTYASLSFFRNRLGSFYISLNIFFPSLNICMFRSAQPRSTSTCLCIGLSKWRVTPMTTATHKFTANNIANTKSSWQKFYIHSDDIAVHCVISVFLSCRRSVIIARHHSNKNPIYLDVVHALDLIWPFS